jgi:antitoxin (DNA-binding transcriptional repressor) of toxin-antitoxin stability system
VQRGESVIIAKPGKPIARLVGMAAERPARERRLGFLKGQYSVPEDFDRMAEPEIAAMFGLDRENPA